MPVEFLPFGLATSSRFSYPLLIPTCLFVGIQDFMLIFIWMISWSWFIPCMFTTGHNLFSWSLLCHLGLCIIYFFQGWTSSGSMLFFLGYFIIRWLSATGKLLKIKQLSFLCFSYSLLQFPSTSLFLGKTEFCANGHAQLWCLCHVIQREILAVYHCPAHLSCTLSFSSAALCQLQ